MTSALEVRDLRISVPSPSGKKFAVDGISFTIPAGKRIALVGESGSGKSLTAYGLMRLLRDPVFRIWRNLAKRARYYET
jgi:ABC-type dipeptide/oligopeptide/nickel transport system ATPase component